jgi:mono/diheme cytochrome c family protein
VVHRGIEGDPRDPASLVTGYAPVVLPRREGDGRERLAPHHLSTTWYWTGGSPRRPVRARDLEAAWFDASGAVRPEIVAALDLDGDGRLADGELRLDTEAKVAAVRAALAAAGVADPRMEGAIEPSGLHHGVVPGRLAVRECASCHGPASRLERPVELSPYAPAGAVATLAGDTNASMPGRVGRGDDGRLVYSPALEDAGRRVAGLHRAGWVDLAGLASVLAVLLGVVAHGALRALHARRRPEAS